MAAYRFRAVDLDAQIVEGQIEAEDETDLETRLRTRGLTLIEATRRRVQLFSGLSLRDRDLLDFTYYLHLILSSGVPIMGGLADMAGQTVNLRISRTASLLTQKLESGKSISESLQELPELFPVYYTSMIRAGEASGNLEQILKDLMAHIEWQMNLKKSVRAALAYPALILTALALLITVLFVFVMPKFIRILTDMKVTLPLPTQMLVALVGFLKGYWPLLILMLLALPVITRMILATPSGRRAFDRSLLRLPLIGSLVKKLNHSRYFRTFATLYRSGLNMNETLRVSSDVVGNTVIAEEFSAVTTAVLGGEQLSRSLRASGSFAPLLINMIEIGEKTGTIDATMTRVSDIYDKEIPETLKKVFTVLEPAIILALGGIVLLTLASFFLPLYQIIGGMRR